MEAFWIRALQLIVSLSLLVIIHEFGHFLFARMFKVRVEKFYLFFNPWFTLFKFKPKNSETEYGIGWLPLGGYVKISGMIDESMDKEQMKQPAKPWEFRSKPAWQRLLIMVGGVMFNFILALLIYSMITYKWGNTYIPVENVENGFSYCHEATKAGFEMGDIPVYADDFKIKTMDGDAIRAIAEAKTVTVKRDGKLVTIKMPEDFMLKLVGSQERFATYRYSPVIKEVMPGSGAEKAGLKAGDVIWSVNMYLTKELPQFYEQLDRCNPGDTIDLVVLSDSGYLYKKAVLNQEKKLGIMLNSLTEVYTPVTEKYSFWESFPVGIKQGFKTLGGYVSDFKYVFTKEGAESLGGFGTIGSIFPPVWNWEAFWSMTAFLSIILAFMNILPIPALDGGHVMFLLYEVITRRKPSDRFLEYAQTTGMILLLALLIFANGNDIIRLFK